MAHANIIKKLEIKGLNSIKFSINAGNIEQYKIVHGEDKFVTVVNNLLSALHVRDESLKKSGNLYRVMVSSIYTKETYSEILNFKNKFDSLVDDFFIAEAEERIAKKTVGRNSKKCFLPFNRLHVTAEGYLSMCCVDFNNDLIYADLNNDEVLAAWNNNFARKFRTDFLNKKLKSSLCGRCLFAFEDDIHPLMSLYDAHSS